MTSTLNFRNPQHMQKIKHSYAQNSGNNAISGMKKGSILDSRKSVKSKPLDGSARCSARTAAAKLKILRVCHRLAVEDAGELGPGVSALGGAGSQSCKRCRAEAH